MGRFDDRRPVAGSSDLFRAKDGQHGGVDRALRVVDSTPARSAALRARIRAAAQLSHPGLARWVTVGEEDGSVLLAREWLPGPALAAPMDAHEAGRALIQVLDALAHAHWHDLHHGGIEPSCLIRGASGEVILADLGLHAHGSAADDLRCIADCLEALVPGLPDELASVVASTHAGAYPTARDQQEALRRALASQPDGVPWGRWLLGGSLLLAAIVAVVVCVGRPTTEPEPVPEPEPVVVEPTPVAPVPVPEPQPVAAAVPEPRAPTPVPPRPAPVLPEPEPEPEPEVVIVPVPAPEPAPEPVVVQVPAPVPEPEPVVPAPVPEPQPMPASLPATGKWTLEGDGSGGQVLTLIGEAPVTDRLGRSGRPVIQVHCSGGKAWMTLHPGVQSVERILVDGFDSQQVLVRADLEALGTKDLKFKTEEGRPLSLGRRASSWLREAGSLETVQMSYTPFASDAVVARFDWRGFDLAWALAAPACQ